MSNAIYITATATDAGKTYISGLLVKKLRGSGLNAGYYKPALSGAVLSDGELLPGDCQHVAAAAGLPVRPRDLVSFLYREAVSPHLASRLEGRPIEPDIILKDIAVMKRQYDYITVEGCGGIVCPLRLDDRTLLQTDIIKLLQLDILIVAGSGLGAINAAVLTADYADRQGIQVKGFILNRYDNSSLLHRDNRQVIERLTGLPVIACVADGAAELASESDTLRSCYKEVGR